MKLISSATEFRSNIAGQHFGIASSHINVRISFLQERIEDIVKGDQNLRILLNFLFADILNFIKKHIVPISVCRCVRFQIFCKRHRIPVFCIQGIIQRKADDLLFGNTALQKVLPIQRKQQIGFAASSHARDHLDQPVVTLGNQLFQVCFPFNLLLLYHNCISFRNLCVTSRYFRFQLYHKFSSSSIVYSKVLCYITKIPQLYPQHLTHNLI